MGPKKRPRKIVSPSTLRNPNVVCGSNVEPGGGKWIKYKRIWAAETDHTTPRPISHLTKGGCGQILRHRMLYLADLSGAKFGGLAQSVS